MAVTKQTYSLASGWTAAQLADNVFQTALIDAGLMTAWHASFAVSTTAYRVMRIVHNGAKAYGASFYYFVFTPDGFCGCALVTGWDGGTNNPSGTQFLDWHTARPTNFQHATTFIATVPTTTAVRLYRYSSLVTPTQSWFVMESNVTRSWPFCFLAASTALQPWMDLDRGVISGFNQVFAAVSGAAGYCTFLPQENLRRVLALGTSLRGDANTSGNTIYHAQGYGGISYMGMGSRSAQQSSNISGGVSGQVILPVGKNSANAAYATDFVPVCTQLPFSQFTTALLSTDFGVLMHHANNTMVFQDKFIVSAGVQEWEILANANNTFSADGASPCFIARTV